MSLASLPPPPSPAPAAPQRPSRAPPERLSAAVATPLAHTDLCVACGAGGTLLCCDACLNALHLACADLDAVPVGVWQCPVCTGERTHEEFRHQRERLRARRRGTVPPRKAAAGSGSSGSSDGSDGGDAAETCAFCKVPRGRLPEGVAEGDAADPNGTSADLLFTIRDWLQWIPPDGDDGLAAHRLCAMWAPRVFHSGGRLCNVAREAERARWISCARCGKRGAAIGCAVEECRRSYHLRCAELAACCLERSRFTVLCPEHFARRAFYPRGVGGGGAAAAARGGRGRKRPRSTALASPGPRPYESAADAYEQRSVRRRALEDEAMARHTRAARLDAGVGLLPAATVHSERRRRAQMTMRAGIAPARPGVQRDPVPWSRVGGLDEQARTLRECTVLPLMYPELFERVGAAAPRGVLLHGPPGTGKTLLARAVATSCGAGVAFFHRKGPDLLSKFYGETEKQLRMLFREARRRAPAVIFFDELDGLAPVRSARQNQVHSSVVATLLSLLDGVDSRGGVFVLAATNRPDAIDPALRRPGRFDRELAVPLPGAAARRSILRVHCAGDGFRLTPAELDGVADRCAGHAGADLRALVSEAVLAASRRAFSDAYMSELLGERTGASGCANPAAALAAARLVVTADDFDAASLAFRPASMRRESMWPGAPPPGWALPLLRGPLAAAGRALAACGRLVLHGADAADALAALVASPRMQPAHVVAADLPSLLAPDGAARARHAPAAAELSRCFSEAARSPSPLSVVLLPRLDAWWDAAGAQLRAALLCCLRSAQPCGARLAVVATSGAPWTLGEAHARRWPTELFSHFSRGAVAAAPPRPQPLLARHASDRVAAWARMSTGSGRGAGAGGAGGNDNDDDDDDGGAVVSSLAALGGRAAPRGPPPPLRAVAPRAAQPAEADLRAASAAFLAGLSPRATLAALRAGESAAVGRLGDVLRGGGSPADAVNEAARAAAEAVGLASCEV